MVVARLLSDTDAVPPPTEAHLRRAVSTAYYALFHKILRAAAQRFMGAGKEDSAGYALLYRGFDHAKMKALCEALDVPTLKDRLKFNLRRDAVSQDTRDFAGTFAVLQDSRHLADYHPTIPFLPSDVSSLIKAAEDAMNAFDRVDLDEQADILALLMVGARA